MSKIIALLLVLILTVSIITFLPVKAEAKTIIVPDDYSSIQTAVDKASTGDTVLVKSGTYHQNVTINKQLSLIGENKETTILYGPRSSNWLVTSITIKINADNVRISGFTIKDNMIGISANGNGIQVVSNVIDIYADDGIVLTGSFGTIANNTAPSRPPYLTHNGKITSSGSNNTISGNIITNNIELTGSFNKIERNSATHIRLEDANSNTISNNSCSYLGLLGCSYNSVFRNIIEGSGAWGILMGEGHDNVFYGNNITNLEYGSGRYGIALGGNHVIAENNTFYHNNINNDRGVGWNWDLYGAKNFWDNGKEGNFWDDERTSATHRAWNDYNVTDYNKDGINDTPYVINDDNVDRYPLMFPFDIENNTAVLPPPEPFPTLLVFVAPVAVVAVVAAGVLVYWKKRKREVEQS